MSESRKTLIYVGVAVVLLAIALITKQRQVTPEAFSDVGQPFFPEFTDPNAARTLEVIEFDQQTGSAKPFKVMFKDGMWTIPSHYDYPADGKDRLAKTAAGMIGTKKDDFRTDNVADFEACGVVDPLDETVVALGGRGTRVTIKGENDVVLADLIIGKPVADRENVRLVRIPGEKRVYAARVDLELSTNFNDWIEADLLKVERDEIDKITLSDYSIEERTGRVNTRDELVLTKTGADQWTANRLKGTQEVDRYKMNNLLRALDELAIVGVRPKPAGLTASLEKSNADMKIGNADLISLQEKGYYFSRDGRLLSNEGELQAVTARGVTYVLRFGEIVYGSGLAVSAGSGPGEGAGGPGENRYLFITTSFDERLFPEPEKPRDTSFASKPDRLWTPEDHRMRGIQLAHEDWERKINQGRALSDELNARFAGWYYVISAGGYEQLRLTRSDLIKDKPKTN
jgi:hypothetical protein